ncbi:aldehyde dehydrogenase domain-containing protein [Aspergillus germanicus]
MVQFLSNEEARQGLVPLIIGGKDSEGSNIFVVKNPDGKAVWKATGASVKDAVKAVEAAEAALPAWAATKPAARRDIFLRAADIFSQRYEEFVRIQVDETGADPVFVNWILKLTIDNLKEVAGKCSLVQGTIPTCGEEGRAALVLREPYGVILGIAPWNAPWPLGVRAFSLALAAGNTCVLKGPELAPKCFYAIVDTFRQAGLPDGVLNLVFHRPQDASEITTTLISHPAVKKVNYTGSTAIGSIISATAGKYLKPIITELGGKASLIVLADADIEKAAAAATMGAFLHAGQVCMATERVIVHASIAEKFISAFKDSTAATYGPSAPVPTLVNGTGAQKTKKLVSKALEQGAEVLFGDITDLTSITSAKMKPIILDRVEKGSDLHVHESFGPSVAIYRFETEAEALAIANDTEYGLSGAVFTTDLAAGLRIARGYETGAVHINHMTIFDDSNLPHGGAKQSGFGRFSALAGLDEWLRYKVVTYDA